MAYKELKARHISDCKWEERVVRGMKKEGKWRVNRWIRDIEG
jgi:hypothetical protein